ncbi:MAG: Stk1 family PASTA domain-containing Ser/Thr kinase [Jatrophihabitans sp.]|uniref:Stk1 family PASTA domain-containing Ser/Thr kinase n=1 Tax=Jatrophihabitans sp. TaxID=1932789 RepID=UPI00390D8EBD
MTQPRIVGGRYELGELIGYGGMAEVHRGRDTRLNREVAIKVLRPDLARDPAFLNRFRREAHSAAGLNHPSIVSVYDTGEDTGPDGTTQPFIVMEFVEGRTLRDIVKSEGRLPVRRAMEIVADVCAALDFSHRNGIIHRDIKPANIMITPAGAVKVMDFGIARAVADNSATVTQTANVIGTAQYLSPEQARGETVDARSDVYSTGCVMYELVTGVPPFQGDSPVAVAYQHVRENPVLPSARNPEIPRVVDSIVMKALAKNQLNRYQSAGDMRQDLQRALADQPVLAEAIMTDAERTQFIARTPPPPIALRRTEYPPEEDDSRRTGLIWAAVVIALLLVIGAAAYAIVFLGKDNNGTKSVAIPSVIGQTPEAADALIRQAKLQPKNGGSTGGACDGGQKVDEGKVCTVDPAPAQEVKEGSPVTYRVFKAATVQVPFVEGEQYTKAVNDLNNKNLKATKKNVDNEAAAGTVLHQHTPQFTQVAPGTTIVLDVSTGKLKLPDVRGKAFDDAQTTLQNASFNNVSQGAPLITGDKSKNGKVATENPVPGKAYDPGQTVTLRVYQYQAPKPTCTSVPASPTPPPPTGTPTGTTGTALPPC